MHGEVDKVSEQQLEYHAQISRLESQLEFESNRNTHAPLEKVELQIAKEEAEVEKLKKNYDEKEAALLEENTSLEEMEKESADLLQADRDDAKERGGLMSEQ